MLKLCSILIGACFLSGCLPSYNRPPPRIHEPLILDGISGPSTFPGEVGHRTPFDSRISSEHAKERLKENTLNIMRNNLSKPVFYGTLGTGYTGYQIYKYFNNSAGASFKVEDFKLSGQIGKGKPGEFEIFKKYEDVFQENDQLDFIIQGDTHKDFELKFRWKWNY